MASATEEGRSQKRLRPFLEQVLDKNSIPYLCWMDREKKKWKMPWKHHRQTRWGDADAFMLREIAKELYEYKGDGVPERKDLTRWKELFRNALRSLKKDFEELKDEHVLQGENPYKVYRFKDLEPTSTRRGGCGRGRAESRGRNSANVHQTTFYRVPPSSVSRFNDALELIRQGTDHNVPQRNSSEPLPIYDVQNQCPKVTNSHRQFNHVIEESRDYLLSPESPHSSYLAGYQPAMANGTSNILSDWADDVNDQDLSLLVHQLSLQSLTTLSSNNFRSRSPLSHERQMERGINNPESSFTASQVLLPSTAINNPFADTEIRHLIPRFLQASESFQSTIVETDQTPPLPFIPGSSTLYGATNSNEQFFCCNPERDVFNGLSSEQAANYERNLSTTFEGNSAAEEAAANQTTCPPNSCNEQKYPSLDRILNTGVNCSAAVVVYYNKQYPVKWQFMSGKFRICYLPNEEARESIKTSIDPQQFGLRDVEIFEMPHVEGSLEPEKAKKAKYAQKILGNFKKGIIIECRDADIYATRYSNAVPHFCIPDQTQYQKMERLQETKVFDFDDNFKRFYKHDSHYQQVKPFVRFVFAMKKSTTKSPTLTVDMLTVDIYHMKAYRMTSFAAEDSPSLEPDLSISDDFDNQQEIEEQLRAKPVNLYTTSLFI